MTLEFIIEVGCEEIPARYIESTLSQLHENLARTFQDHSLAHGVIHSYATPRRLVLVAPAVEDRQADRTELVTGPPQSAAFDAANNPTASARGFAAKHGLAVEQLRCVQTEKGLYLGFEKRIPGRSALEILSQELPRLLGSVNFPKSMRWESSRFFFCSADPLDPMSSGWTGGAIYDCRSERRRLFLWSARPLREQES
ncbi:MAG: glycine--tRNA ligase subunit beta [Terriglobia bacterium]